MLWQKTKQKSSATLTTEEGVPLVISYLGECRYHLDCKHANVPPQGSPPHQEKGILGGSQGRAQDLPEESPDVASWRREKIPLTLMLLCSEQRMKLLQLTIDGFICT